MKNTLFKLMIFTVAIIVNVVLISCEEEDDAKDYDYDPVVLGVNGPTEVIAHGCAEYPSLYELNYYRGGSTVTWSVTTQSGVGDDNIIISTYDEEDMNGIEADIVFPLRDAEDVATITVVEETSEGKVSDPYELTVVLNPFCQQDIDYWVGTYTGTESIGGGADLNITVTISKKDETTLVIEAIDGIPGLLSSIYTSWGETFQEAYGGLAGDIELTYNPLAGVLGIEEGTFWGGTDPDQYEYYYAGSGTWDGCNNKLIIDFEMHYDDLNFSDGGNRYCHAELTKDPAP